MRRPSILRKALAAPLLFTILLIARDSFATNTASVQDGDTYLAIADSAGISVESLEAANPDVAATDLYAGQVLNVPSNNEPATGTPASNPASSPATSAPLTTLITSPSPAVSSSPSPSVSSSPTPSVSATISSTVLSSPTSSTMVSPTSTIILSSAPSTTTTVSTSVSSSAPSTTTTSPSSSTLSSSTTTSSSSTAPSTTSTTSTPSSNPVTSTTSPPPPPSSTPPSTTASVTTNSPPSAPSCRPTPTGKYHDAADVQTKTNAFCKQNGPAQLGDLQQDGTTVLNGDSQPAGYAGQDNTAGYNMTINILPNCLVENASVMYPLPLNDLYNCTGILFDSWDTCYSNDGMGGSITAGCFVYSFDPDS